MKKRRGSQNPTKLILCRYKHKMSRYDEAVELYERTGRTAQRWQVLLLRHILATDKAGLWVHTKFGYAVPRRNGKNEVVVMREIFGLKNGEHILHTAHRTTTTHAAWERLYDMLQKAGIPVASTYRAYGREHIFLKNGGKIEFRTRTSKGGLGEGFDLLVIDEAQEYQDDQESSLKYTVSDSPNPQTILCGTPPTPISAGTVFVKFRQSCLAGELKHSGWAEWSVEYQTDPRDKEAWYLTNPSLGTILNERKITDEIGPDPGRFQHPASRSVAHLQPEERHFGGRVAEHPDGCGAGADGEDRCRDQVFPRRGVCFSRRGRTDEGRPDLHGGHRLPQHAQRHGVDPGLSQKDRRLHQKGHYRRRKRSAAARR